MSCHRISVLFVMASLALPAQVIAADGGDLYNNIFSDLGPLISLFGEQATMQFLSQALGLADCIVIAMAPLGIITILVSAIRVGGLPWLKAVIGRASENLSAAEKELLSSTSHETCELWNGNNVVRCQGSAEICEFILLWPDDMPKDSCPEIDIKVLDKNNEQDDLAKRELSRWNRLQRRVKGIVLKIVKNFQSMEYIFIFCKWLVHIFISEKSFTDSSGFEKSLVTILRFVTRLVSFFKPGKLREPVAVMEEGRSPPKSSSQETLIDEPKKIKIIYEKTSSPNMFLNRHDCANRNEIYSVAVLSVLLQLGVLIFYAAMTYHPKLKHKFLLEHRPTFEYPFYLTTVGTVLLSIGLLVCAHVIQRKTEEKCYVPHKREKVQVIWLQQGKMVNDQKFDAYATYFPDRRDAIVTSRRRIYKNRTTVLGGEEHLDENRLGWKLHTETLLGTFIGLTGYVMQLIGLRGMHWVAALVQFIATVVMTMLRTWLRREALVGLGSERLTPEFELDWLALSFANVNTAPWFPKDPDSTSSAGLKDRIISCLCKAGEMMETWYKTIFTYNRPQMGSKSQVIPWKIISGITNGKQDYKSLKSNTSDPSTASSPTTRQKETVSTLGKHQLNGYVAKEAQKVMGIRQELGKITEWQGPSSALSLSLARAINGAMDILFPSNAELQETGIWCLDVMLGENKDRSQVVLNLERAPRGWKIDAGQINAALSLWLYTAKSPPEASNKDHNHSDSDKQNAEDIQKGRGLRLLGPKDDESLPELIAYLERWSPEGLSRVLAVENVGKKNHKSSTDSKNFEVDKCRVVGYGSSGLAEDEKSEKTEWVWCRAEKYVQESKCDAEVSASHGTEAKDPQKRHEMKKISLAIESFDSLELLYAKDLLFAFMCAAAATLSEPIQGETQIKQTTVKGPSAWKYYKLWNENLERLAQVFESNGFGSSSEVYSSIIIPSLAMKGKLPDSMPLLRLGIKAAVKYEKAQEWHNAVEMYLRLWGHTKVFQHNDGYVFTKTVAAMMDFMGRIQEELFLRTVEGRATYQLEEVAEKITNVFQPKELKKSQSKESKALPSEELRSPQLRKSNFDHLLGDLLRHYEKNQGRPWKWNNYGNDFTLGDENPESNLTKFNLNKLHKHVISKNSKVLSSKELNALSSEELNVFVNEQDVCDWTPLHYAAALGMEREVLDILAIDEVDPNSKDLRGWTPLHYACLRGHTLTVEELLAGSALLDAQGVDGVTPMHCAVLSGKDELVRILQKEAPSGKYPKLLDFNERSPLHWAAIAGNVEIMKTFKRGFEAQDVEGWTLQHLATIHQQIGILKLLLDMKDIPKEPTDKKGRTPLILAAEWGKYESALMLVSKGADIEAKGDRDRAALYYAVLNGHPDIVQLLLECEAEITAGSATGKTMLYTAASRCDAAMVKLLLKMRPGCIDDTERTIGYTAIAAAASSGRRQIINLLVSHKADVKKKDKWGNNLLHIAIDSTNSENLVGTVLALLEANVDPIATNENKSTPLVLVQKKLRALEKKKPINKLDAIYLKKEKAKYELAEAWLLGWTTGLRNDLHQAYEAHKNRHLKRDSLDDIWDLEF